MQDFIPYQSVREDSSLEVRNRNLSKDNAFSLPSMGPNFNFYKFKDLQKTYKMQFNATSGNLFQVDKELYQKWGEEGLQKSVRERKSVDEEDTFDNLMTELNNLKHSPTPPSLEDNTMTDQLIAPRF